MRCKFKTTALAAILTLLSVGGVAMAAEGEGKVRSMFEMFVWPGGGGIGALIILMDVVSISLIIEYFIKVRRVKILPDQVRNEIVALFERKQYRQAIDFTAAEPSFLAQVVHAALREAPHGHFAMQRAMAEAVEEQVSRWLRKIEPLNLFGNISPMMGLLGTVYGMILAFEAIVAQGGVPNPALLANAIGIKLVSTFWGLVVAVPALSVYAIMRNRIDGLAAEAATTAQSLLAMLRPSARAAAPVPAAVGQE
jgi:biopolymer transport protein ExbB